MSVSSDDVPSYVDGHGAVSVSSDDVPSYVDGHGAVSVSSDDVPSYVDGHGDQKAHAERYVGHHYHRTSL